MPHTGNYGFGALASIPVPSTIVSGEPRPVTDRQKPDLGLPKIRPRRPPRRGTRPLPTGVQQLGPTSVPQTSSVVFDPYRAALERRATKGLSPNNPADLQAGAQTLRETGRARIMREQAALRQELGIVKGATRGGLDAQVRLEEQRQLQGITGTSRLQAEAMARQEAERQRRTTSSRAARLASLGF